MVHQKGNTMKTFISLCIVGGILLFSNNASAQSLLVKELAKHSEEMTAHLKKLQEIGLGGEEAMGGMTPEGIQFMQLETAQASARMAGIMAYVQTKCDMEAIKEKFADVVEQTKTHEDTKDAFQEGYDKAAAITTQEPVKCEEFNPQPQQ
jgi:uncharacterized pyridoxal phosphate-containing UPF0001 family protein